MIKEVKAYKTTDDNLFLKELDAKKHQNGIDFKEGLHSLIDDEIGYHEHQQIIYDFIDEHKKELLELFKKEV